MAKFNATLTQSLHGSIDVIQYLFHSKTLDMMVYVVLHLHHAHSTPELLFGLSDIFLSLAKHLSNHAHPASIHVETILTSLIKFTLGEPHQLSSDSTPMRGFF
jgi:hypothetical protein